MIPIVGMKHNIDVFIHRRGIKPMNVKIVHEPYDLHGYKGVVIFMEGWQDHINGYKIFEYANSLGLIPVMELR